MLVPARGKITVERRISCSLPCSNGRRGFGGRPSEGCAIHLNAIRGRGHRAYAYRKRERTGLRGTELREHPKPHRPTATSASGMTRSQTAPPRHVRVRARAFDQSSNRSVHRTSQRRRSGDRVAAPVLVAMAPTGSRAHHRSSRIDRSST